MESRIVVAILQLPFDGSDAVYDFDGDREK